MFRSLLLVVTIFYAHVSLAHGFHSNGTQDSELQTFLLQLAGRGVHVHFLDEPQTPSNPSYVVMGSKRYPVDSNLRTSLRKMLDVWSDDEGPRGMCEPKSIWSTLRTFFRQLTERRYWVELSGQTLEYAQRLGPPLAFLYALTEMLDPMHGVGCKFINVFYVGAATHVNFAWRALLDNRWLDRSLSERVSVVWQSFAMERQYRRAMKTILNDAEASILRQTDYEARMAAGGSAIEQAVAGSVFWPQSYQSYWRDTESETPDGPSHEGHVHAEVDLDSARTFQDTFTQIVNAELPTAQRFMQAKDYVAYLTLELDLLKELSFQVHNRDPSLWWKLRFVLTDMAQVIDRFDENLKILALASVEGVNRDEVLQGFVLETQEMQKVFAEIAQTLPLMVGEAWYPRVQIWGERLKDSRRRLIRMRRTYLTDYAPQPPRFVCDWVFVDR